MQPLNCPRCQFRVVNNKRACATCGFKFAASDTKADTTKSKNGHGVSLWSRFVGLASAGPKEVVDPAQEKPALG